MSKVVLVALGRMLLETVEDLPTSFFAHVSNEPATSPIGCILRVDSAHSPHPEEWPAAFRRVEDHGV